MQKQSRYSAEIYLKKDSHMATEFAKTGPQRVIAKAGAKAMPEAASQHEETVVIIDLYLTRSRHVKRCSIRFCC